MRPEAMTSRINRLRREEVELSLSGDDYSIAEGWFVDRRYHRALWSAATHDPRISERARRRAEDYRQALDAMLSAELTR